MWHLYIDKEISLESLTILFHALGGIVWGPIMLVLLVGTGIYLTVRLFGLQIWLLPYALRMAFSRKTHPDQPGDISQFQALMTALAATIGTGNCRCCDRNRAGGPRCALLDVALRNFRHGHQVCRGSARR